MASSLFVNAMQVNFEFVLTMEHCGMAKVFKSLEVSGLKGFLEASDSVYESAVIEFFTNAKVIAGKIVSLVGTQKMALTKDQYTEDFGIPSEGLTSFLNIPKETVAEMRHQFSGPDETFRAPNKKMEMKIEFRLLHDVVAKALCAKAESFDQGFAIQISVLLRNIVKENIGESVKLHPQKVLTSKSVRTYIKKNLEIKPTGESSKQNEDTASNIEGGESQGAQPRTQRPQTQQRSTGERDDPQHGSIPAVPVEGARISAKENIATGSEEHEGANREQDAQMGGDFQNEENQGLEKETENSERAIIVRSGSEQQAQPNIFYTGQGLFTFIRIREINWGTHIMPKIAQMDKGKGTLDVIAKLNPVEEHCQLVLKSAWNNMSAKMDIFDEWTHFCREVRLKDISSFDHLSQIEEQLLEWGETEKISELFERRSLIMYKLYGLEVEKLYNEHLDYFKLDAPSVNHDYLCIRCLNEELKEIATLHRAQLALAGLPLMAPEASFAGMHDSEAVKSQDHQAHENEPSVQEGEHQALDDEHQAHCEHNSLDAQQEQQGTHSFLDEHGTDHHDPSPSNLRKVTYTPDCEEDTWLSFLESSESSHTGSQRIIISSPPDSPHANFKLEEVDKDVASIDSRMIYMDSKLTSMDSRTLSIDSKMHSMESKLRSMNSNIEQLMDTQNCLKLDFGRHKNIIYDRSKDKSKAALDLEPFADNLSLSSPGLYLPPLGLGPLPRILLCSPLVPSPPDLLDLSTGLLCPPSPFLVSPTRLRCSTSSSSCNLTISRSVVSWCCCLAS
ncbi:hypothetical protein F511_12564 [Dorcoceras hygrometricum]|uniref:Uncharacterized protein n=1 Tax=Dorcoceras hygrometricum TaxID=472368 RepID=A0A2Z7D856_9LAMI|nr:hypothetical protein F511_12564 [Dorcoceras hygrometricum]